MKVKVQSYGVRTDKAMQTWIQLSRTFNKISSEEIQYLKTHDLTLHQFKVLEVLYHRGDLTVGEITKLTMSTPGNITVVVKNLKRDCWIEAVADEKDRRSTNLSITKKGIDVINKIFPQHAENLKIEFAVLDDSELETLFHLLRKIQKAK